MISWCVAVDIYSSKNIIIIIYNHPRRTLLIFAYPIFKKFSFVFL